MEKFAVGTGLSLDVLHCLNAGDGTISRGNHLTLIGYVRHGGGCTRPRVRAFMHCGDYGTPSSEASEYAPAVALQVRTINETMTFNLVPAIQASPGEWYAETFTSASGNYAVGDSRLGYLIERFQKRPAWSIALPVHDAMNPF